MDIFYIERDTKRKVQEKVYGERFLHFLYKDSSLPRFLAKWTATSSFFSAWCGFLQKLPWSKRRIAPFVKKYGVNTEEFTKSLSEFSSFNDFFTRQLKKESRPLASLSTTAIIPADGRFLCYQNIQKCDGFLIKGKKFSIKTLLNDEKLSKNYEDGSMVIARLCPSDYHRFHFPFDCKPSPPRLINGPLFSVNPISVKQNIDLLSENKRMITELDSLLFGKVIFIEIGALCVGTIHQTFISNRDYKKGDEKGFFSFGGSSIIVLFEQNRIQFDFDLITNTSQYIETLCLMGQPLGNKI